MAKCPICKKNLTFSMSENTWKCPSGCNLQGKKINEEQKPVILPKKSKNSTAVKGVNTGYRLSVAAFIYFIIAVITHIVFAIICSVAEDKISVYAHVGSILDVAFYSAIAYVVGDTFSRVNFNSHEIKMSSLREDKNTELLNQCIEKIDKQQNYILQLTKRLTRWKKK